MANEWTKVELYGQNNDGDPRRYTCASGTAISKGTLLVLSDPRTVAAHASIGQYMGGVAAMDKSATDGSTSISAWTNGIFEGKSSGTMTIGLPFKTSNLPNHVEPAANTIIGSAVGGYALETGSGVETINLRLRL